MGYFDALTTSSFKTTEDGRRLFFPWGKIGKGYLIPTEAEYIKLRRTLKIYMMMSFPLIILASRLPWLFGILVVTVLLIPYFLWAYVKSRNLQITQEKLTFKEHTSNVSREYSWLELYLLELGAVGFVLAGLYILLKSPENWIIALASILFFGMAAVVFAKMIVTKKKQTEQSD